jgi:Cof subfamily protein (haloacid dehalogenase superfamily)
MAPSLAPLRERYDAILFDLDGTLLDGRAQLTARTAEAVKALVDAGLLVILSTGRSVPGTRRFHEALRLSTPIVAYNGAFIGRPGEVPWRYAPIPDPLVDWVERTEQRAHFSFRHQGDWKYTLTSAHGQHDRVSKWYENVVRVGERGALPRADLMRVSCYFDGAMHPDEAWEALPGEIQGRLHRETFPLSIFPTFEDSDLLLLELQGKGRGKAEAFEWLSAERNIPAERTIAVGDHVNDLPMIEAAGLAVAMANAVAPVKATADLVIGHHAEEGVARWVEAGAPTRP